MIIYKIVNVLYLTEAITMLQKVKKIISEQLEVEQSKLSVSTSFIDDLGADSIDLLELVLAFEDEFGVEIDEDDIKDIKTVGNIVEYIENKK
jgi:acyl carrier protein